MTKVVPTEQGFTQAEREILAFVNHAKNLATGQRKVLLAAVDIIRDYAGPIKAND